MPRVPIQIQAFVYRLESGTPMYLLLKRRPDIGGFWQGVTGALKPGEAEDAAAAREIMEETGLDVSAVERLAFSHSFPVEEQWKHLYDESVTEIFEHAFAAETVETNVTICDEHTEFKWVNFGDAYKLLKWPGNKGALEVLNESLKSRK